MAAVVVGKGGGGTHGKHILHSIAKICNSNDYNIVIDTIIMQ